MEEVMLLANTQEEPFTGQSGLTPPLSMNTPNKISLVSGGFDPIHSGHISLIHGAKNLTGFVVVALNGDEWLQRKKGRSFMPIDERRLIIDNLKHVSHTISQTISQLAIHGYDSIYLTEGINSKPLKTAKSVIFINLRS